MRGSLRVTPSALLLPLHGLHNSAVSPAESAQVLRTHNVFFFFLFLMPLVVGPIQVQLTLSFYNQLSLLPGPHLLLGYTPTAFTEGTRDSERGLKKRKKLAR